MPRPEGKPSQPSGERSPFEFGISPEPESDEPPMEEKGMERSADDHAASSGARDVVIEVWHQTGHWSIKKNEDQYWHKRSEDSAWQPGLPPGMTTEEAWEAFSAG